MEKQLAWCVIILLSKQHTEGRNDGQFYVEGDILEGGTNRAHLYKVERDMYQGYRSSNSWYPQRDQPSILDGGDRRGQRFLREPPDQTAKIGEQVTLPCRVENKQGKLQWTRDDFGLGLGRDLTGFDRYTMTGSDQEGDYTLSIYPVELEDDAIFQCQVGAVKGVAPIRSRYATLTVTVPPEPPVILNGDTVEVLEERTVTFECVSKAGKPAAEITWLDSHNIPIREGVETVIESHPDGKRQNTISMLRRKILRSDNLRNISCEAQNVAESIPRRVSLQIKVEYPPSVTLHYTPHILQEGETVNFKCSSDANPPRVTYRWFLDTRELEGENGRSLVLPAINRTLHGTILKCVVQNRIGRSEETHTMTVTYPPVWRVKPADLAGEDGEPVVLSCLADSYPPPRYTWYKIDTINTVVGRSKNLTVILNHQSQGVYTCRVDAQGFEIIESSATVRLKGPPIVSGSDVILVGIGEEAELLCAAEGIPTPQAVLWTMQGSIMRNGGRKSIDSYRREGVLYSTLKIQDIQSTELGVYNCTASNMYGIDHKTVSLKLKEDVSFLIPLGVGITGGIFLTIFLLFLAVHCRRSSQKFIKEEISDKDEWNDTIAKDKHVLKVQEEEVPLNQHFDPLSQSPLVDKYININLNVQDPNYSAVYGNPYLRAGDTLNYRDTYDHNFSTEEPPIQYRATAGSSSPPLSSRVGAGPVVDAKYIFREDVLSSSLATHV